MTDDDRLLMRSPWFAQQKPALREAMLARARIASVGPGQWIYGTGDALNGLYGVIEGTVHLLMTLPDGETRLLDVVQSGQFFGQPARFGGGPRLVTAIAGTKARLLHVPDAALAEIARGQPDVWRNFAGLLYGQLAGALLLAGVLIHLPPPRRVAARLALLATRNDTVAVAQAELAEMTGLSRKTVNIHLRALERAGIIAIEYRRLRVTDRTRLQARADAA
jgi:CRP-like cAMP-binding protein